jgi:chromosome segregation ATPase
VHECRNLEDERRRVVAFQDEASTATAARDTWKSAHSSLETQLREALQDADSRGKDAARLRATGAQLEDELERLRGEASSREAAFEDSLKQLDAAAARLREAEAVGGDTLDKLRHTEARAAAAEEGAARLQAANEDLSRR